VISAHFIRCFVVSMCPLCYCIHFRFYFISDFFLIVFFICHSFFPRKLRCCRINRSTRHHRLFSLLFAVQHAAADLFQDRADSQLRSLQRCAGLLIPLLYNCSTATFYGYKLICSLQPSLLHPRIHLHHHTISCIQAMYVKVTMGTSTVETTTRVYPETLDWGMVFPFDWDRGMRFAKVC
jgi:hypothetical protein